MKEKKVRTTLRQKIAFRNLLKHITEGKPFSWKMIMLESGYSEASAGMPERVLYSRPGFQQLLVQIDDEVVLGKVYEILLGDDKRSSLTAAEILLKLKDRFPAQKSKVVGLFQELKGLEEDEPDRNTEGFGQGI